MVARRLKDVVIPPPDKDERVGKLFVPRTDSKFYMKSVNGTYHIKFPNDCLLLFLGIGKSVGRRFNRGRSQYIHNFLWEEKTIELVFCPGDFGGMFRLGKTK